ncbi:pappalysin-1-like [Haliotis cracherodii]|uniref:pappalysin-1-like n=1 Tax=Haliotis cracherodii TaxID=6455 RepID=UPI0039E8FCAB
MCDVLTAAESTMPPLLPRHPTNSSHRIGVLLVFFILLSQAFEQKISRHFAHTQRKKDKVAKETKNREDKLKTSYSVTGGRQSVHVPSRYPRDVQGDWGERRSKFGNAVYFSGRQVLNLTPSQHSFTTRIPMEQFTVELWVRPEGGQADPVTFLELYDTCDGFLTSGHWSLGLQTFRGDGATDVRFFFSLQTQRSSKPTAIFTHTQYQPNKWIHIVASYDGSMMVLYINGAGITVATDQKGNIFGLSSSACKEIHLGGNISNGHFFRGSIDELRLWQRPLKHINIKQNMFVPTKGLTDVEGLVFGDNFNDVTNWKLITGHSLEIIHSNIPYQSHDISVSVPSCGKTVCDDPNVVQSYTHSWQMRHEKVIQYRVVNLMDDDGLNPIVTQEQIIVQHGALKTAFEPYNITFDLSIENIRNSSLRKHLIMIACDPMNVGDGNCQAECQHPRTGYDGGDCDSVKVKCNPSKKGNGKCDFECNKAYHDWDSNDCCLPGPDTHYTCFNHTSPWRGFLGIEEYKDAVRIPASSHLNVFLASTTTDKLIGLATFPWEKHVYTHQGGIVVQSKMFRRPGQTNSLVHEIGHNLGLWHVHHGVSEMECDDPCVEKYPSLEHGDLCADTTPTPENMHCHDPDPTDARCGLFDAYTDTPYRNYMSNADDNCTNHFSQNQVARMHCYLDLVYKPWITEKIPSPVPLPPRVLSSDVTSTTLAWISPFSISSDDPDSICSMCTEDGALFQYADDASSPNHQDASGEWAPVEATGPPDAVTCDASTRVWMPDVNTCKHQQCYIDLSLRWPVKPASLTLWATWNAHRGLNKIRLYYTDRTVRTLTEVDTYCNIPFTTRLAGDRKLRKIRIYTRSPYVAIDAIEILSQPVNHHCSACSKIKYKVTRSPPFTDGDSRYTSDLRFSDLEVEKSKTYSYWVTVMLGTAFSAMSPPLIYTHGQHYCGDGHLESQSQEECDDDNAMDGDGCNVECKIEEFFHCQGSPSLCYRHEGDGVCEDFEVTSSVSDCGYYTPPGYRDQWAHIATANPQFQLPMCPETVVTGPPDKSNACGMDVEPSHAWFPCGSHSYNGNFWIELYFLEPVVATEVLVYIGSDGRSEHDPTSKNVTVELIKSNNDSIPLSSRATTLDCSKPITSIPVTHDLSRPFFHTTGIRLSFNYYRISFRAVRLRSSRLLDPVTIATCGRQEVYSPRSLRCITQNCSTTCPRFLLQHALPQCSGHTEGHTCTIHCMEGYRLEGETDRALCASGKWVTAAPMACVPVDCGIPAVPFASSACPFGTTHGNNCTFKCNPPARQQGYDNTIRCETDGLWSAPTSTCHIRCYPPLQIPHAKLVTRQCKRGRKPLSTTCKFKCKKGFYVEKQKFNRRSYQLTCGDNGEWNGPRCVRLQCPSLPVALAGLFKCSNKARSRCVLRCKDNSQPKQKIICKSNGMWSGEFKPCRSHLAAKCEPPSHLQDQVIDCPQGNYAFGTTCGVRCRFSIHEAVYMGRTTRRKKRVLNGPATGQIITNFTCTGSSHWFPNPRHVKCVEKCSVASMSDGWCDGRDNREHCNWDGGDCCRSTVGGQVMPFAKACTSECACKDPKAKENVAKRKKGRKKKKGDGSSAH